MRKKILNIVLLAGGASVERPVSKMSSKGIYEALVSLGHNVTVVDPGYGKIQPDSTEDFFGENDLFRISQAHYIDAISLPAFANADTVFIGLHGKWGEDGTLQSLLELKGYNYTGSGVLASSLSMDKGMAKVIFKDNGVSVPDGFVVQRGSYSLDSVKQKVNSSFSYPLVVKPNDQGSTFGLSVCKDETTIKKAMELAFSYSDKVLVEQFIPGRELTVGILENRALTPLEIVPKHELYDYECKYTKGMSEYLVPAPVSKDVSDLLKEQALLAYFATGCKGYSRVDFRLSPENKTFCMELNTLPGMTPTSLLPKMAKAEGISFEELVQKITDISLTR